MRSAISVAKETQGSDHDPNALVNPASVGRESAIESRRKEEITMDTRGFVVPPGQGAGVEHGARPVGHAQAAMR
jgi:hypothetical protein